MFNGTKLLSSLLRGISISTKKRMYYWQSCNSFRPLYGVSLFLPLDRIRYDIDGEFSSPLRGISISTMKNTLAINFLKFSSPLRGISISTDRRTYERNFSRFSSPLRGISISTARSTDVLKKMESVFVPSTGYLYFYIITRNYSQNVG